MKNRSMWSNLDNVFRKFKSIMGGNPLCIGVKTHTGIGDMISGTIDHLEKNNARVLQYELEFWGRLALIEDHREELQNIWDNYGLVSQEDWHSYRRLILGSLEEMYKPQDQEYSTIVRRKFEASLDPDEFEELLIGDIIARTGDLPKVMYVSLEIDNHLFDLRTDFHVSLSGLGLKESDQAVLYVIDPTFYKKFKRPRPNLREIKKLVLDLQRTFQATIYYYPGWDIILELGIENRWYKLEESYEVG